MNKVILKPIKIAFTYNEALVLVTFLKATYKVSENPNLEHIRKKLQDRMDLYEMETRLND